MIIQIKQQLLQYADSSKAQTQRIFFKNSRDSIFLGVCAKEMRSIAKDFWQIPLPCVKQLMSSDVHDERNVAHAILRLKYQKGTETERTAVFDFYLEHRHYIRDWGGVDDSAPYIAGPHLLNRDKTILYKLAKSAHIWDKRIAIVTTWWFIRNNKFEDTINIATLLLQDQMDLIQKAVGWMLREMGKRNHALLITFLNQHAGKMPRTMLRYAIEKLTSTQKKKYMKKMD